MSLESFPSPEQNNPEENKEEQTQKSSSLAKNMRRLVTSAALIGGALGSSGEKLEAQGIHIPGTNMNVSFGNPFKKHGAPQEAPRIITAEDRMKIDTVLAHYNIEKQGFNSYLVTNKEGGL